MLLSELIIDLRDQSGRLDLSDTQIIALLNKASMLLDQFDTSLDQETRYYHQVTPNSYTAILPTTIRWIKNVNIIANNTSIELYRDDPQTLRPLLIQSDGVGTGIPTRYCRVNARIADNPLGQGLAFATDLDTLTLDPASIFNYLLIYPVPNQSVVVEVVGYFFSPLLSLASPTNKWTNSYPDLLLQASNYVLTKNLMHIEESVKLKAELKTAMLEIIYDSYMNEDIDRMEG